MSGDSYSTNETYFQFEWPSDITGIERIALTAKGDLQRTLSAFFGKPISVARIWSTEPSRVDETAEVSITNKESQVRRVHLLCEGQIVCICTSNIIMSTPETRRLFLEEKYAIGQMYRHMNRRPEFVLRQVGTRIGEDGQEQVWRKYVLRTPGFECEIEEVFCDRTMFQVDSWILEAHPQEHLTNLYQVHTPVELTT